MRRRLTRNVLSNYLGFGVHTLVALLLTPFLINKLGSAQYGVWVLINALIAYFQLLEFGVTPSIIKFVSFHRAREEKSEIEAVVATALRFFGGLSLLTVPVIYLLSQVSPAAFNLEGVDKEVFSQTVGIAGFAVILAYFKRLFFAVIEGHQRYDLVNLSSASSASIGAIFIALSVMMGGGLRTLIVILAVQTAYEVVFEIAVLTKVFGLSLGPSRYRGDLFKQISGYSYYAYLIDIAVNISYKIDTAVIGIFLPMSSITVYAIATRIAGFLEKAANPLIDTFFPLASELHAEGDRESLQKLLVQGTRISVLVISPGLIMAYAYGPDLIRWWVGPEFVAESFPVLQIFLAVIFFSVFESTSSRILLGTGEVKFNARVSLVSAATNLGLSLLLAPKFGVVGVAMGTLVPSVAGNFLISPAYVCRLTGTPIAGFYTAAFSPSALVLLIYLALEFITNGLFPNRIISFAFSGVFVLLATAAVFFKIKRDV
ncbi:MAG: polysaccharide biosynthesis C-terminal domain-containing protein [Nitrospinae bacterium]|nr:polysaccharide biosynthesis C-terminal domain-containing protein [Nitrospinota bacterium]